MSPGSGVAPVPLHTLGIYSNSAWDPTKAAGHGFPWGWKGEPPSLRRPHSAPPPEKGGERDEGYGEGEAERKGVFGHQARKPPLPHPLLRPPPGRQSPNF